MAAFDLVMAFVAFVSFVAGFGCSYCIKMQDTSYRRSSAAARKKERKQYVRIADHERSDFEAKPGKKYAPDDKKSKFDALCNYFSEKGRAQKQAQGYENAGSYWQADVTAPYAREDRATRIPPESKRPGMFGSESSPAGNYVLGDGTATVADALKKEVESPVSGAVQHRTPSFQEPETVRKKESAGDEWVPMGFFED